MSLTLRWFWGNSTWCFVTLLFTTILRGTGEGVQDKGEGGGEGKGDETADGDIVLQHDRFDHELLGQKVRLHWLLSVARQWGNQ